MTSEKLGFGDGQLVHHIQARLASEDTESWEPATVTRVAGPEVTIRDGAGRTRTYTAAHSGFVAEAANDRRTSVFVTERWRILAFASEEGQVIGNPKIEHHPGSIFALSGSLQLRFVSIARVDDQVEEE